MIYTRREREKIEIAKKNISYIIIRRRGGEFICQKKRKVDHHLHILIKNFNNNKIYLGNEHKDYINKHVMMILNFFSMLLYFCCCCGSTYINRYIDNNSPLCPFFFFFFFCSLFSLLLRSQITIICLFSSEFRCLLSL